MPKAIWRLTLAWASPALVAVTALIVVVASPANAIHKTSHGGGGGGASLGALSCDTDEIARFNGSDWVCDVDTDTLGSLPCGTDEIARFGGSDWFCDVSPPGPLVVRDDDGILVGTVFEFRGADVVRADGKATIAMQMDENGVPRIFVIEVGEAGFFDGGGTMFSEDGSCGAPLYKALKGGLSNLERATFHDGIAYISETGSGPVFINRESSIDNEGVCHGTNLVLDDGPYFLVVEVNLTAFTPPFSAGF